MLRCPIFDILLNRINLHLGSCDQATQWMDTKTRAHDTTLSFAAKHYEYEQNGNLLENTSSADKEPT